MEIRSCTESDLRSVYELVCELENKALKFEAFEGIYNKNLASDDSILLAAEHENQVVGFLSLFIRPFLHHADLVGTIEELDVRSALRGQKIGTRLIERAIEIARERGCDTLELTSNLWREDAHRFYERNGFTKGSYKFVMRFNQR